jgi:hypothetical protein
MDELESRYSDATILSEPLRSAAAEEPRKRLVRFCDNQEESSSHQSIQMGGLLAGGLLAGGMAGNHTFGEVSDASLATLDIFDDEGSPSRTIAPGFSESTDIVTGAEGTAGNNASGKGSDASFRTLDMFDYDGLASITIDAGSSDSKSKISKEESSDDETDEESVDSEDEKEKQIRRSMLFAMFGVGAMGLAAFGFRKIMNIVNRDRDQDAGGAGDMVSDVADSTMLLSDASNKGAAAMVPIPSPSSEATVAQASMNASAQQSSFTFTATGALGNNAAAMTGAQ